MPQLKYHDGSNWQPILQQLGDYSVSVKGETLSGTVDGTNKNYTVSRQFQIKTAPDSHAIAIFKNGVRMTQGSDYNIDANRNITFVTAPASGSILIADYDTTTSYAITGSTNFVFKGPVAGTKDGSNKTFQTQTAYLAGTLQVYLNGQMQGNLITETFPLAAQFQFDVAPSASDSIEVSYQGALSQSGNADTVDGFHAGNGPGQIPVLDSSGKLPASLTKNRISNLGSATLPSMGASAGATVVVSFSSAEPDTNYKVILTQETNNAYWSYVFTTVTGKTTSGFTLNGFNNGGGPSGAATFSYIVVRT